MPPIRSVKCADDLLEFTDSRDVTKTLQAIAIPPNQNTIAKIETYINNVWIPTNVSGFQMQVHIFSRSPLRLTVFTANLGIAIPANWWMDL